MSIYNDTLDFKFSIWSNLYFTKNDVPDTEKLSP